MPATYTPIATTTLGSAASSYTFSSIPATFTDLIVEIVTKNSAGTIYGVFCELNGDTGTNYSSTMLWGNGANASSARYSNTTSMVAGWLGNTEFGTAQYQIMNYSNTTTYKTMIGRFSDTNTTARVGVSANLYRSTSAVTQVKLISEPTSNFAIGSTFTIYGIKAA